MFHWLNKPFPAQNSPRTEGNERRNDECDGKSEGACLHAVHEVHSEERCHQRREHHHDGYHGERAHHGVHVVVDDARIGVHRRFQNVGVDVRQFASLAHLDVHVLDEVGVEFIYLQFELQFLQQVLVAPD